MKKIFALILAIVMMASMSVVVFAETYTAETKVAGSLNASDMGGTVLTYGVTQAYTVTIPADQTFALDEDETDASKAFKAEATVKAEGVKIAGNEFFVIKVASKNGWKLVDSNKATSNSADVTYAAAVGARSMVLEAVEGVIPAGTVLSLASTTNVAGAATPEGGVTIDFTTAGTGQEGNYQDTLTFKVEIVTTNPLA